MLKHVALTIISCLLIAVFLLPGYACVSKEDNTTIIPEGYTVDNAVSGGQNFEDANLKEMSIARDENADIMRLTFDFVAGSLFYIAEETDVDMIPEYEIKLLHNPERMAIVFNSVKYADYSRTADLSVADDMVYGMFELPYPDEGMCVYIQMKHNSAFRVNEDNGLLNIDIITLESQPDLDEYSYYVAANIEGEYLRSDIELDFDDLTPTLTRENGNISFISVPCDTHTDAQVLRDELGEIYPEISKKLYVMAMYTNDVPEYNADLDYVHAYEAQPLEINGEAVTPDLLIDRGIYLTTSLDGELLYCMRENKGDYTVWKLYITGDNGGEPYLNFEFETIEVVDYSPDGTRIAVLENTSMGSHLYVFDVNSKELIVDLSEAGFGKRISRFVWSETGSAIYAVSGTDIVQVNMYDFRIADESKRKSILCPDYTDESGLDALDGELYFVLTEQADSQIFSIRPEGGARRLFRQGSAFSFSPDGQFAAITTASSIDSSEDPELIIMNMDNGETVSVNVDFAVYDFVWSFDSRFLYFVENTLNSDSEGEGEGEFSEDAELNEEQTEPPAMESQTQAYPYILYAYDIQTGDLTDICRMEYSSVYASESDYKLYLPYYDLQTMGDIVCATYVIDVTPE